MVSQREIDTHADTHSHTRANVNAPAVSCNYRGISCVSCYSRLISFHCHCYTVGRASVNSSFSLNSNFRLRILRISMCVRLLVDQSQWPDSSTIGRLDCSNWTHVRFWSMRIRWCPVSRRTDGRDLESLAKHCACTHIHSVSQSVRFDSVELFFVLFGFFFIYGCDCIIA